MSPRDNGKSNRRKKERYFDYSLLFIIIFLVCFGLVMLYSTSSYNGQVTFHDSAFYLKKQMVATILGLIAMLIVARIDYHFWERFTLLAFVMAHILSAAVLLVGTDINGSKRWLKIAGVSFQPSEFAKLAVILFLALVISKVSKKIKNFRTMILVMALCGPIVALVGINNLSSAIIILGIAVVLIFVASPKYLQFILIGFGGIGFMGIFIFLEQYRAERLEIWLHPEIYEKGYQTLQALYAIGSGGILGKGLGESMQKLGFVPEAQNDMIFSIICEELGLFGAVSLILLFLLMIWRFMVIANNAPDLYGSLIVVGIMGHIAIQVILNIAVVTNSIPNTGITLPFISYGGTSALFLLSEMGLALSVARQVKLEK
jgi:cell division protein FtsW